METISLGPWLISYDAETTRKVYIQIESGGVERCGCEPCLNFARARKHVYPEEATKVLDKLGVDFTKEAEVYHFCRVRSGWHHYGGLLHFVGSIQRVGSELGAANGKPTVFLKVNENFSWCFSSKRELVPVAFGNLPVVRIIFDAKVPWVLGIKEPD